MLVLIDATVDGLYLITIRFLFLNLFEVRVNVTFLFIMSSYNMSNRTKLSLDELRPLLTLLMGNALPFYS